MRPDNEPNPDATTQLAQQIYHADILPLLVTNMPRLEFEAKKDVVAIFNGLLRRQIADRLTTVEYLVTREATIVTLSRSYMLPGTALQCGQMLRECLRHEQLATVLLTPSGASTPNTNSPSSTRQCEIWNYFDYIENSTFDIASDAFSTFRMILTLHKHLAAEFLQSNYDRFFEAYTKLLTSSNYVWKRQSLKLLGEILLDRVNYNVMSVYIKSTDNLKLMMNLLRDRSAHIQFEAFHVFKVFVANPNKEDGVRRILRTNKEKLVVYLSDFHNDRKGQDSAIVKNVAY